MHMAVDSKLPPASLDPDLVEFLDGADPSDAALEYDDSGAPAWRYAARWLHAMPVVLVLLHMHR